MERKCKQAGLNLDFECTSPGTPQYKMVEWREKMQPFKERQESCWMGQAFIDHGEKSCGQKQLEQQLNWRYSWWDQKRILLPSLNSIEAKSTISGPANRGL